jgi:hypothetical protein
LTARSGGTVATPLWSRRLFRFIGTADRDTSSAKSSWNLSSCLFVRWFHAFAWQTFLQGAPAVLNFDFRYIEQFLVALVLTSLTVLTHSAGMSRVRRYFKRSHSFVKDRKLLKRYHIPMTGIIAIMMGTHFIEVIIWAVFYLLRGVVPDVQSAILFSINNYTTVGAGNITVLDHWRGIGGVRRCQEF